MSETVDERVVEMRFDNANFERNVQTSMSTLDKLKQKLNLSGAAKGLEQVDAASKKVSFSKMENSLAALEKRFSTTGIIGMSVINNLTTSVMRFVSKVKGFVTGGIVSGGIRRAMNLENAQFQLNGLLKDASAVEDVMKNVNDAVDGTAYSLDAAASVASQLAASGMTAGDEMFSSLRAVAGVAAMTNSSYEEIGRIFTQVAGQGRMMGDQLLQLSARGMNAAATLAQYLGVSESEVREMTSQGEIDFKTFAAAMDEAFGEHAKKANETFNGALSNVKSSLARIGALFVAPLIQSNGPLVEFFNALREKINDVKASIGPFAEKVTDGLTKIINVATSLVKKVNIQGFIDKFKNFGKNNPFSTLAKKIDEVTAPARKAANAVKDLGDVVNKVIKGDFGNGKERFDALTKAGYDWAHVQNLVNEKLGDSTRHATNYTEAQDGVYKAYGLSIDQLTRMSKVQLKNLGFTDDEIDAFRELEKQSKKTGIPIQSLIDDIDQLNGKTLILESFKRIGEMISNVFKSISSAWKETFSFDGQNILYDMIAGFRKFTSNLVITDEDAEKLKKTFKGVFAILDVVRTIVGGGLRVAFKVITTILGAFNLTILDVTSKVGDLAVKFRDFLVNNKLINKGFELLGAGVKMVVEYLKDLYEYISNIPKVQKFVEAIKDIDLSSIGENILDTLKDGLKDGISSIPGVLSDIGKKIFEAIKGAFENKTSSTTKTYDMGYRAGKAPVLGFEEGMSTVRQNVLSMIAKVPEWLKGFDLNKAFAVGVSAAMLAITKKLANAVESFSAPLKGLGSLLSNAGGVLHSVSTVIGTSAKSINKVIKSFSKVLKAEAFKKRAEGIKDLAISLGILAASVYFLAKLDPAQLWSAVGAMAAIAGVLIVLSAAMDKLGSASVSFDKGQLNFDGLKTGLLSLGLALLAMAVTVKILGNMDPDKYTQGFYGLIGLMGVMILVFAAMGKFVKGKTAQNADKVGKMLSKLAIALLLLAVTTKLIGSLSEEEMLKGAVFMGAFLIFVTALTSISLLAGKYVDKIGGMVLKITLAMALMVGVVKLAGLLSVEDMMKGAAFAGGFIIFLAALLIVTKIAPGKEIDKLGGLLLKIALSMLLMAGVVKLVSMLSVEEMLKGAAFAAGFLVFVAALIAITKIGSEEKIAKVAGTILAMSLALAIMAGVCVVLGLIKTEDLAKGVIAVSVLGLILAVMIKSLKGANNVMGSIVAMSVAIAVMALSVAALSMIDPKNLAGATLAMTILMGMFALIAKSSGSLQGSMGSLIAMVVAVGLMAGILVMMSMLNVKSSLESSASLALLMLSLAGAMQIVSKSGKDALSAMPAMLAMAGVLAIVAIILGVLAALNVGPTLELAVSLSLLMLSLAASMRIISGVGETALAAMPAMYAMSGVLAIVALILGVLAKLNVGPTLETAASLSLLLISLSVACLIMAGAAAIAGVAAAGLGPMLVLMIGMGALMAAIAGLVTLMPDLETFLGKALPILKLIGEGIGEFLGGIIAGIGNAIMDMLPRLGASLSAFMVGAQPFILLAQQVDSGVLAGVGYIAGAIIALTAANFISAIGEILSGGQTFAKLGMQLTAFIVAALPFLTILRTIDPKTIESAKTLADVVLALTAADLMSSVSGFIKKFTGGSDFSSFGDQLVAFGKAVVGFNKEISGEKIDNEAVAAAAEAGKAMSKLAKALPRKGGFLQNIVGEQDLGQFGLTCVAFGAAMTLMTNSIVGQNGELLINNSAITEASKAGKAMSKLAKSIPKKGGFLQNIVGEQDLGVFGNTCKAFGAAMVEMNNALMNENGGIRISQDTVDAATNAGKAMVALQEAIPKKKWLDGTVTLDDFGSKIKKFGDCLVDYSSAVSGVNGTSVTNSVDRANELVGLTKSIVSIDTSGIKKFGAIKDIGKAMKKYSDKVAGINISAVATSVTSAVKLKGLIVGLNGLNTNGIEKFDVTRIGESMKAYSDSVSGINVENVSGSVSSAEKLVSLVKNMASIDSTGADRFESVMSTLGNTSIESFVETFSTESDKITAIGAKMTSSLIKGFKSKQSSLVAAVSTLGSAALKAISSKVSMFDKAGKTLGGQLVSSLSSCKSDISSSMTSALHDSTTKIRSYYGSFFVAGSYLVSGFASGISSNMYKSTEKAKEMAMEAYYATKGALDINSPSKIFRRLAYCVPEGFADGIVRMGKCVTKASSGMATLAINGTTSALSAMANLISNDMDTQPTIRPVLDLTNVKTGVKAVSGMFNSPATVGVNANLNAVSASMNGKSQNGGSDEIVSAINKLNKNLGNVGNTYNSINGVSYDDGSAVAEAIGTIVRAARVERRR